MRLFAYGGQGDVADDVGSTAAPTTRAQATRATLFENAYAITSNPNRTTAPTGWPKQR